MTTAVHPSIADSIMARVPKAAGRVAWAGGRLLLVALLLLPVYGALVQSPAWAARFAVAGMLCITFVRPEDGLLLCAAFFPIGGAVGAVLDSPANLREPFVLAFLAGWVLRGTVRRARPIDSPTRTILRPVWLLGSVVAASVLVQLAAYQPFVDFPSAYALRVVRLLASGYVTGESYPGLAPGAAMLEALGVFTAVVVLCRREAGLTSRVISMAGVGSIGVALVNLYRFAEICLRRPGWFWTVVVHPRDARVSLAFPDVNAAGSYLVMMLLLIVGLVAARRRTRWLWAAGGAAVLAALWVSGSRTAPIAALMSAPLIFSWHARRIGRASILRWMYAMTIVLTAVMAVDWYVAGYGTRFDIRWALRDRSEFWFAAVRAVRDHPIFGVGIGRYLSESGRYILDPIVRAASPQENAHNNFLQVLAELGVVGFVAFVWSLAAVARRAVAVRGDLILAGSSSGVLAFLLTCLVGHPLLIPEVAIGFWLLLGLIVAQGAKDEQAESRSDGTRWGRAVPVACAAAIACVAGSVPIRAHMFLENEANLETAAIGFSKWQYDGNTHYRTMTGRGRFYLPGAACYVRLNLRLDKVNGGREADVDLSIEGHLVNRIHVQAGTWKDVSVEMSADGHKRFREIDLASSDNAVAVLVSRPELAMCDAKAP